MRRLGLVVLLIAVGPVSARAGSVLYEGGLGTRPDEQGWIYVTDPLQGSSASHGASGGVTTLDTTAAEGDRAGYFSRVPLLGSHPDMPILDRFDGFTIRLDLAVLVERHSSDNRAGFSLIVVSDDLLGLELGFWEDQVWAQADDPIFTKAESAAIDTTAMTRYDLAISGSGYSLFADGLPLLSGMLRNYSAFGLPYSLNNFLFLGDNTSSASARVQIGRVEVLSGAIPEPSSLILAALSGLLLAPGIGLVRKRNGVSGATS